MMKKTLAIDDAIIRRYNALLKDHVFPPGSKLTFTRLANNAIWEWFEKHELTDDV